MFLKFLKNRKYTIILVLVILGILVFAGVKWYEGRMFWVKNGMADPKFPFQQYTFLELARQGKITDSFPEEDKLIEQWKNVPTRTTPLETFDIYSQALKDGDIERAAECLEKDLEFEEPSYYDEKGIIHLGTVWKVRDNDKEYLYDLKEEGHLDDMVQDLNEIRAEIIRELSGIKKEFKGELEFEHQYQCKSWKREVCYIRFVKDFWGDWKLSDPYL